MQSAGKYSIDSTASEILKQYSRPRGPSTSNSTRPEVQSVSHTLFRYESDGIVVYDSTARLPSDSPVPGFDLAPRGTAACERKDVELANEYDKLQFFAMPMYLPCKPRLNLYTLLVPEDSLRFDSHFESGNLHKAVKVTESQYRLWLEHDVMTKGHTQWYYFSVANSKSLSVQFTIENLMKYDSLYLMGMQPVVYSKEREKKTGEKWHRAGTQVAYFQNCTPRIDRPEKHYYTLSFQYSFDYPNDTVYFAHCFPYSHSDLLRDISTSQEQAADILRVDSLCTTLAGNSCPVLTITSDVALYPTWESEYNKMMKSAAGRRILRQRESRTEMPIHRRKKAVVLTARVHPGESNSSFMLKGAIEFLLGSSREARILRREYVFKIIPMLNPDGVKYGNYRCSLLGVDLNRRWLAPNRLLHPTIYHSKRLIQMVSEEHELILYCDLHGHSMKRNVFVYGCTDKTDRKRNTLIKLVPLLMQEKNRIFSFTESHFRLEKSKEATARVVVYREFDVANSYTLEASFCGPSHHAALENRDAKEGETSQNAQMNEAHLASLGRDLCKTLLVFLSPHTFRRKLGELTATLSHQLSPPSFLCRETPAHSSSPEEKAEKALEDLEQAAQTFTITHAIEEIGRQEGLMEELALIQEAEDGQSSGSDASLSDSETPLQKLESPLPPLTPRTQPSVLAFTPPSPKPVTVKSIPHRPAPIPRPKQTKALLNQSVGSADPLESLTTDSFSPSEDPKAFALNQQVERIYKMLKYYKEAGGRLKAGQVLTRARPYSPMKLNQSAFPDSGLFDNWRRKRSSRKPSPPPDAVSVSPERLRRERRAVRVEAEDRRSALDYPRFSVPASARDTALPGISKSFQLRK